MKISVVTTNNGRVEHFERGRGKRCLPFLEEAVAGGCVQATVTEREIPAVVIHGLDVCEPSRVPSSVC